MSITDDIREALFGQDVTEFRAVPLGTLFKMETGGIIAMRIDADGTNGRTLLDKMGKKDTHGLCVDVVKYTLWTVELSAKVKLVS